MKEIFGVFAGGVVGNVLYVHTLGDSINYHWVRSFVLSALLASVLVLLREYRQRNSRQGAPGVH